MSNQPERVGQGVNCPDCKGRGTVFAFASRHDESKDYDIACEAGYRNCSTCGGSGAVTQAVMERREAGLRLRQDRLSRDMSLREEAKRLGISATELSARERGRA